MTMNLFDNLADVELRQEQLGPGATVLRQFAVPEETALLSALEDVIDPVSSLPWPQMPDAFLRLATGAAAQAGFSEYVPDACLINRYELGARLSLHQDKNEQDIDQPIVSVSLGIPAVFLFGGLNRADKAIRVKLTHGDVVIWGGPARLRYHGVLPLKEGHHPLVGDYRINLTFRKAA